MIYPKALLNDCKRKKKLFFNECTSTNFHQTKCEIKATFDIFHSEWIVHIKRKIVKT